MNGNLSNFSNEAIICSRNVLGVYNSVIGPIIDEKNYEQNIINPGIVTNDNPGNVTNENIEERD